MPFSLSLWKRPADFRPILRKLKERVSTYISESKEVIGATPDQVQRFLIGLQDSDDRGRGMHWMCNRFGKCFEDRVKKLKSEIRKDPPKEREELQKLTAFLEGLGGASAIVTPTGKSLFGGLPGLRISSSEYKRPDDILEMSSALAALQNIPNEIGYYVFVVGPKLHKLQGPDWRGKFRDWVIDSVFYESLSETILQFLTMSAEESKAIWQDRKVDPRQLFKNLSRRRRRF
jgi:hypothetical protein